MALPAPGRAASALRIPVRVHDGHQALRVSACGGRLGPAVVQLCCKPGACQVHEHLRALCILGMRVPTLSCRHCILSVFVILQSVYCKNRWPPAATQVMLCIAQLTLGRVLPLAKVQMIYKMPLQ